jgi:hypothetical protein
MKIAATAIGLAVAAALGGADALAQSDPNADPMDKLRACLARASAERLDCLEKLSRDIGAPPPSSPSSPAVAPAAEATPAADDWIVSETTSPFDYSPIAIATVSSTGSAGGSAMQLSIQCRGGGTELVIVGAALEPREIPAVSYRIDDGAPVTLASGTPAAGTGVAIKGDVVRLLASLPELGEVAFRIAGRQGAAVEGRYALPSLKAALKRLAAPCKWPAAVVPRN